MLRIYYPLYDVERKKWSEQEVNSSFRRIMMAHTVRAPTRISLDSGRSKWSWNS
jgi:hypothetical protein